VHRSIRKTALRCGLVLGLVFAIQLFQGGSALAVNCAAGYAWTGQYNNTVNYEGIQGEAGHTGTQTDQGAIHFINYYDLSDPHTACNGSSSCWLQAGFGQGNVGNYLSGAADHAYFEGNDVNGYIVHWKPTADVTASSGASYISLSFITTSSGDYEYEADSYNSNGVFNLGDVWLAQVYTQPFVQSETEYVKAGTCATFGAAFYYGANATGGFASSTYIEASFNAGITYTRIANTGWVTHGPGVDQAYAELNGNRYMFKTNN
jgi:hypothetical protein